MSEIVVDALDRCRSRSRTKLGIPQAAGTGHDFGRVTIRPLERISACSEKSAQRVEGPHL